MIRKFTFAMLSVGLVASLSACDTAKKQLGVERSAPDEFAVVKRAPLEMPPDFSLRPPQPGAQRPQELTTDKQAKAVVFGDQALQRGQGAPQDGESALLQNAGATNVPEDIRYTVDQETAELEPYEKPVAEKLLGIALGGKGQAPASVVDPAAEAARLQKNIDEGKSVTTGETPTIEQ